MRRFFVLSSLAVTTALLVVAATASAGQKHATGGGTFFYLATDKLEFTAHDYGPPTADSGNANYENVDTGFSYNADIICAHIEPGEVRFGYVIPPSGGALAGTNIIWVVKDGGSPGAGNDSAVFYVVGPGMATTCDSTAYLAYPVSNVYRGNYTVHDG